MIAGPWYKRRRHRRDSAKPARGRANRGEPGRQQADSPRQKFDHSRFSRFRVCDVKRDRELFDSLVVNDFGFLRGQRFAASDRVLADLLPQSVVGRAQQGHGHFVDDFGTSLRFPEATFDRVLSVLEKADPSLRGDAVRERRGRMLARFSEWLMAHLNEPQLELVVDGEPLFGIGFLAEAPVDTRSFLTGLVLAGFMDDWSYRESAMYQHHLTYGGAPFRIGGGDILIVDRERLAHAGLGDTGRVHFDDEQLRVLQNLGVICRDRKGHYSWPQHDQAYFRRCMGDGVCDDMAMINIGANHGYDALLGAFVMDAIDTYDKYLLNLVWGGFDTSLARRVQAHFRECEDQPLVGDRDLLDLIYFAAKRNDPHVNLSSSHRRLIQYEPRAKVPTLLNHWRFLQGEPLYDIKLGFARVPAREFYPLAARRLDSAGLGVKTPTYLAHHVRDRG